MFTRKIKLETSAKTDHVLDRLAKFAAPWSITVSPANLDCIRHRIRKALHLLEPEDFQKS
jgi:flagellar biosynthesis/type III secretory pathway protein FliH